MANNRRAVPYQYEPPVTPQNWYGDEQRYAVRMIQILDDLYNKYSALRQENLDLRKRVAVLEGNNDTI